MSGYGYQHACKDAFGHGRFPAVSRPSDPKVSFPTNFVGLTLGSGPAIGGAPTAAPDPKEKSAVLEEAENWSLTTLRNKLIKIGAKVVRPAG
jgi:hypothetical protein